MSWIDIIWPMVMGACLTLALINLRIGLSGGPRAAHLFFALNAVSVAVISFVELAQMHASSPAEYGRLLFYGDVAMWVLLASMSGFIWVFFRTGNKWLALLGPGVHAVGLLSYPFWGLSPSYVEITRMRAVDTFGGATFQAAEGVPNPWNLVIYTGVILMLVFVVDASVRLWQQGGRRRAWIVGGSLTFFLLAAGTHSALVESGTIHSPYLISWSYLAILIAMSHELTTDVCAAAELSRQLRESEERMALAADAANLGMWVWDVSGDDAWMTEQGRALFGFKRDARIDNAAILDRVHPEDRASREAALKRALQTRGEYELDYRVQLPDGDIRWVSARGRCVGAVNGYGPKLLGVSMDVTARKNTEMEAARQRAELAHLSRVALMGEMASSLAHELNQPLTGIVNNASAGRRFISKGRADFPKLDSLFESVTEDGKRAGEIIRGTRSMVRKGEEVRQLVELRKVIEDTLRLVAADALAKDCTLVAEPTAGLARVEADAVQLQQVLLNLIVNACEAVRDQPPTKRQVHIRAQGEERGRIRVSVRDFGPGLPAEKPQQIFEQYFSTKREGLGMGLAIARGIITAHGGELIGANAEGGGACFHFTLPVCSEDAL